MDNAAGDGGGAPAAVGAPVRAGQLVRLRRHVPANRGAFQRWYADEEIARLLRHDQEPLNEVQSRGYFDSLILPLSARGLCYALHEAASDRLIGTSALTDVSARPGGGRSALFRIVIGEKDVWGRGYGTEATRLVMDEAFETHDLSEVRLEVFRHNPRALAAYQRVGFAVTGEHVEWIGRKKMELRVVEMALRRDDRLRASADPSPVTAPVGEGGVAAPAGDTGGAAPPSREEREKRKALREERQQRRGQRNERQLRREQRGERQAKRQERQQRREGEAASDGETSASPS